MPAGVEVAAADAASNLERTITRDPELSPAVAGVFALASRDHLHVWVILTNWDRTTRFRVYEAHEAADQDVLDLHVTDNRQEVPSQAYVVGSS